MTILLATEKFDHFNLARAERYSAICKFRNILREERERVVFLLKGKNASIFSHGAAFVSNVINHELNFGLEKILNNVDVGDDYPAAQFFCHYFTWSYERSNAFNQGKLRQRLIGQLSSTQGLSPLFAELEIAFSYLYQGSDVHLIDLMGTNESSHDLIIIRNGIELNVEVKSIRYDTNLPASSESLSRALSIVSNWADQKFVGNSLFEIKLVLRNIVRPTYAEVQNAAEELIMVAEAKPGEWQNRIFKLEVKECSELKIKNATAEKLLSDLAENNFNASLYFTVPPEIHNGRLLISLTLEKPTSHTNPIGKAMTRACQQLPRNKLRIVHLCLVGTGFLKAENLSNFTRNYLAQDKEIIAQFRKPYAKELVGACISCDSFYVANTTSDGIISAYPYLQLLGNPQSNSMRLYINNFTPKQIGGEVSYFFQNHPY